MTTITTTTITPDADVLRSTDLPPVRRRPRWPLWGVATALLGGAATLLTEGQHALGEDRLPIGPEDVADIARAPYHVGVVLGFLAVAGMLVTSTLWRRWAAERAPGSVAASVVGAALHATAAAMMLGYGFKGSMAIYMPGGMDEGWYSPEGLYPLLPFLDFSGYIAWWGASTAAAMLVWMAFRERRFPRWMGAFSAVTVAVPFGFMVATGLPGMPGIFGPMWLLVISAGLLLGRRSRTLA